MPVRTQSTTVIAKARAVDHCPTFQGPSLARSATTKARTPSSRFTPAGNMRASKTTIRVVRSTTIGTPIRHQPGNEMSTPSCLRINPRQIRFGGVPIGVASPPTDEAKATQRNSPVAK